MTPFIEKMLSGESSISSKRVNGTIGFLISAITIVLVVLVGAAVKPEAQTLLLSLLATSTALLGAGLLERGKK